MIDQIMIALTGLPATLLSQTSTQKWRRWSCIFGALGQPFWFYTTFTHQQWGMFGMCFVYTAAWGLGIRNNWIRKG
jgi:hypothetical protein